MENKHLKVLIKRLHLDINKADENAKLTEMCRVCLCETKGDSYKLQDTMIFVNERHEVKNMLEESTGIQIVNLETLPNRICFRCLKSLKSWYKFRSQCQRTDDILQKFNTAKDKKSIPINIQDSSDNDKRKAVEYVLNCDCCNMTFINKGDLAKHKKATAINADSNNAQTFQCDICSRSFLFELGLRNHKELFHYSERLNPRPVNVSKSTYICTICGKSFSKLDFLKRHNFWPCVSLKLIEQCKVPPLKVPLEELIETGKKIIETTTVSCVFCKKDFKNEHELNSHVSTIHKEINRTCDLCKKDLKTVKLLETHMRNHLRVKNYSCPICDRPFHFIVHFRAHIIEHSRRELVYRCNVCQKEFLIEYEFVLHMKTHLLAERNDKKSSEQKEDEKANNALETNNDDESESDIENESNISGEDDSENKSSFKMETDVDTYSLDGQETSQILKREKDGSESIASIKMETDSFIGNKDSKEHLQDIKLHDSAMETCVSEEVNNSNHSKQINTFDNSQSHVFSAKTEKPESIDDANEKLNEIFVKTELNISADEESANDTEDVSTPIESNSSQLEQYELDTSKKMQKIVDEIQFTCHIKGCGANIPTYYDITEHFTKKHLSDDSPLECSVCLEQFKTKKSIISHIKKKYYVIKCPVCSKIINKLNDMRKHIIRMHCMGDIKNFECPKCNKKYKGKGDLKIHLITHSEKKNFFCDSCPKAFFSYNGLYLHSKSHKVIKELQCQICGKQTSSKYRLQLHTKLCLKRKVFEKKSNNVSLKND